jgi:hypothetical protein
MMHFVKQNGHQPWEEKKVNISNLKMVKNLNVILKGEFIIKVKAILKS